MSIVTSRRLAAPGLCAGRPVVVAGVILIVDGVGTWFVVQVDSRTRDHRVDGAGRFAGDDVDGPLRAYSEAQTIEKHALEASGGKTYARARP